MFTLCNQRQLILASSSPRRQSLLASTGLNFSVFKPSVTEPDASSGEDGISYARKCCLLKGLDCARNLGGKNIILAADTVVCLKDKIFGKPADRTQALQMLQTLNGNSHEVITAFCILYEHESLKFQIVHHELSKVAFAHWPNAVLLEYAQSDEPLDKAGAYAIQGKGAFLIESISGSWSNVVGLPLSTVIQIMLEKGLISPIPASWRQAAE